MAIQLRVMAWNLAKGRYDAGPHTYPDNSFLEALLVGIHHERPDILFVNELLNYDIFLGALLGVHQDAWFSERVPFPFYRSVPVNRMGIKAHIYVSILARYPLGRPSLHRVKNANGSYAKFGAIQAIADDIAGRPVALFSLRFMPNSQDNAAEYPVVSAAAHRQLADHIAQLETHDVILGGDFNAGWNTPQAADFRTRSRLRGAHGEMPLPGNPDPIDGVFWRGDWRLLDYYEGNAPPSTSVKNTAHSASDHPYHVAVLVSPAGGFGASYTARAKLQHWATGVLLHSHRHRYSHRGSSGQQQVTGFDGSDGNDWWQLVREHLGGNLSSPGIPIRHGDVIRLLHIQTGQLLHSHSGHPSPLSGQQEVTAFSTGTRIGDQNDNWVLQIEGGIPGMAWRNGQRVRLVHQLTGASLHSHRIRKKGVIEGQQEVTAYPGADDNDWWVLTETE
jgi:hypothetical protein